MEVISNVSGQRSDVRSIAWLGLGMANRESSDNCIKLSNGLLQERLVKVDMETEPVAGAGLIEHLATQCDVAASIAAERKRQLTLHGGELSCAAELLVQPTQLLRKTRKLLGKDRGADSTGKATNANLDGDSEPIVIVIVAGGCALVRHDVDLDALTL